MGAAVAVKHQSKQAAAQEQARPDKLLGDAKDIARILGISTATLWRYSSSGRLGPKPIPLSNGCTRWRVDEIKDWVEAGCPDRKSWLAMREG